MIGALERNECCAFNPSSEFLPLRELYARVGTSVQHQGRRSYILQQMPHIDFAEDIRKLEGVLRRRRNPLQIVEPLRLLGICFRNEEGREYLAKHRTFLPPPLEDQSCQCLPAGHV